MRECVENTLLSAVHKGAARIFLGPSPVSLCITMLFGNTGSIAPIAARYSSMVRALNNPYNNHCKGQYL